MNKTNYRVAAGVTTINGASVPDSGVVELSPAQALFDLAHGRLEPDLAQSVPAIDLVVPREQDIATVASPMAAPMTRSRRRRASS